MKKLTDGEKVEKLEEIMKKLRSPEGCPWDRADAQIVEEMSDGGVWRADGRD